MVGAGRKKVARTFGRETALIAKRQTRVMNILFVSHAATRGGAPRVLLELLHFLKRETTHKSTILSARRGPLESEFARFATPLSSPQPFQRATQLSGAKRRFCELDVPRKQTLERMLNAAIRLNARRARSIARGLERFDWVYANSAASGEAVRCLEPVLRRGARLLVHVHELSFALSQNQPGFDFLKQHGDKFIAASNAVRDELINNHNIAPEKIEVVYEWLDFDSLQTDKDAARRELRQQIGAPDDAVLIGGCGTLEQRKGADWWVQSAFQALSVEPNARKTPAPLHFVWLGGGDNSFARDLKRDVRGFGVEARVHFLPNSSEPKQFFAGLDAFCLSSREDPFPLVCVESAAQSVPVACFAGAGGASELVGGNGGAVVAWGDCASMGKTLASWGRDRDFRQQLGRGLRARSLELCDAKRNCARVVAILENN